MKHRGIKLLGLFAILAMVFGITGAAFAAPAETPLRVDACPGDGDPGWTKIDSDDLSLYPVDGADDYCFKFGSENSQGCTGGTSDVWPPDVDNYCGLSHWSYHMPEDEYEVCSETTGPVYGEWSDWSEWFWNGEQFERTRTRSVTYFDSQDQEHVCLSDTETEHEYDPACPWNPEIRAGDPACQAPPDEALATLVVFCGGGVNVNLANATLFIQFADQDGIEVTESGKVSLDLGDYSAWAEAHKGFEFPEGTTTQWEFSIDRCPRGHEEPPTGPIDSIPLSAALPIAGSALGGLALLGSAIIRRKRQ